MYDPKLGRFFNEDPITKQYPELTPYQFASNSPIQNVDVDGLEGAYFSVITKLFESAGITTATATRIEKMIRSAPSSVGYPTWEGNSRPRFGIQFWGEGPTVENKKDVPLPESKIIPVDKGLIGGLADKNKGLEIKIKSDPNSSSDGRGTNFDKSGGVNWKDPKAVTEFSKGAAEGVTNNNTYISAQEYKFSNQTSEPQHYSFGGSNPIPNNDSLTQRRFYNKKKEKIKTDTVRNK